MSEVTKKATAQRPGIKHGKRTEASVFWNVKPGQGPALREGIRKFLAAKPGQQDTSKNTVHEVRIVPFDNDTRLMFAVSFDGEWDPYIVDFLFAGRGLKHWSLIFDHLEGTPDEGVVNWSTDRFKEWFVAKQLSAGIYIVEFPDATIPQTRNAFAIQRAFQQVLNNPAAAKALEHPALKPLLELAAS